MTRARAAADIGSIVERDPRRPCRRRVAARSGTTAARASHNGEPAHVAVVERMLAKAGLDVSALECGTHWPRVAPVAHALAAAGQVPSALHNNCSGKHAGFLCLACALCDGVNLRQYA